MIISKKDIEKNKELIDKSPFLLPRNIWTGEQIDNYNYEFTEYDNIERGWRISFGEFLLEELKEALERNNYMDKFQLTQIKEKYGSLHICCISYPEDVYKIIQKYQFISEHVCMRCGNIHATIVNDYGWNIPLCKDCWDKISKNRQDNGYKIMSYNEAAGQEETFTGEYNIPTSYVIEKYSNGCISEIEINIADTVEKIISKYEERNNQC